MDDGDTNSTTDTFNDNPLSRQSRKGPRRNARGVRFSLDENGRRISTAVIVINVQNEFVDWTGTLHSQVGDVMEKTGMLYKVPHVIRAARDEGAVVIHSHLVMNQGAMVDSHGLLPSPSMISRTSLNTAFIEGSRNSNFAEEAKPVEGDVILKGRKSYSSSFSGTQLKDILKKRGIKRLFVMGLLTNRCVQETVEEASQIFPDLTLYVCHDGCAAYSLEEHYTAIYNTLPRISKVISCSEAQDLLIQMSPPRMKKSSHKEISTSDGMVSIKGGRMMQMQSLLSRPGVEPTYRPRILALHGARSNNDVTRLQLENLGISQENCDIVYLRGSVQVREGDPEQVPEFTRGPFYTWIDDKEDLGKSLVNAVSDVLIATKQLGPFDGIFGFSLGGLIATLSSNVANDPSLKSLVIENIAARKRLPVSLEGVNRESQRLSISRRTSKYESATRRRNIGRESRRSVSYRGSIMPKGSIMQNGGLMLALRNSVAMARRGVLAPNTLLANMNFDAPPFRFVVLACASLCHDISILRKAADIFTFQPQSVPTRSYHLIGIEDGHKRSSEAIASFFTFRKIMYMPGGHEVSREIYKDKELRISLRDFMRKLGQLPHVPPPTFSQISDVSSMAIVRHQQVALVQLKSDKLPGASSSEGMATIRSMLQKQPPDKPLLHIARSSNQSPTTYGDVLSFIHGGFGDLRRLGVEQGEVVAYVAPPGGNAVAALAFLSIGAQTTAAPLAPNTTEPDALDALDQFNAKHLILFEGVKCPGIEAAFEQFVNDRKAKLHRATILGDQQPGIFQYLVCDSFHRSQQSNTSSPLMNPEDGTCLLLRTSGTTSRPKGVPLQQRSLVINGAVLASSMGLQQSDVCYSVMPLFHIGGISASILCTLASGGSLLCDNEAFDPGRMVDALAISKPQPTWYSAVPTIHNSVVAFLKSTAAQSMRKYTRYGIKANGVWEKGHSLRMIRSGAAALLGPDGAALASAYGGIPIYPTYSMSEQMPISQPPAGKTNTLSDKPGSVGVPIAASTAIVNRATLRPQPYGVEGEIVISGPTVMRNYLNNPSADEESYFYLTLPEDNQNVQPYFRTGDVGTMDKDGYLSLKGRSKELIKKGGEQISPFEVEELLIGNPFIRTAVCFAVPSKLYGEEVGCVLVPGNKHIVESDLIAQARTWLKEGKLSPSKWPTKWVIRDDDDLPKTKTKKYIRVGLHEVLGLFDDSNEDSSDKAAGGTKKAKIDWEVLRGLQFCLACCVMFMHIGKDESWGPFCNLRGWPVHVHIFFTLGGYSMASPMNPAIKKKFSYFLARLSAMYPMYVMALLFGLINLLVVCRPSTFRKDFHWDAQPNDLYLDNGEEAPLFCEGTPVTPTNYWASLVLTIATYLFGMAVTPFWPVSWWLGYYLWFSSMYYLCLAIFPALYNSLFTRMRKRAKSLLMIIVMLLVTNAAILITAWLIWRDGEGYNHYDPATGLQNSVDKHKDGSIHNIGVLSFYLFGPFWMIYFVIGACLAFLYDAYRPAEKHNARIWGWVADGATFILISFAVAIVLQGRPDYQQGTDHLFMRPDADTSSSFRLWDNIIGRVFCPLTTLWIFALSTGNGYTAMLLRSNFLVESLAPHSYNCFLFHQMVAQWYHAATRDTNMWNWWSYRKTMYWFSPKPCPVEWYEYFSIVGLVVLFSTLMNRLEPIVGGILSSVKHLITRSDFEEEEEEDIEQMLRDVIQGMTGIEIELDWTLEECGLASIGIPVLVGLLNKNFSRKLRAFTITVTDFVDVDTIHDLVDVIEGAKELADHKGI